MQVYPALIEDLIKSLSHAGDATSEAHAGRAVNFECGSFIQISLEASAADNSLSSIRFRSNGCGYMVAAAEAICREFEGVRLTELYGLAGVENQLETNIGTLERGRMGCIEAVIQALKAALKAHRDGRAEEFSGEMALICTCFGVSEETLVEFIDSSHPTSADEVARACRAGSGCGSCRMIIQELIDCREI